MLQFKTKSNNSGIDQEEETTTTPSPTTSFSETSTTTVGSKRWNQSTVVDQGNSSTTSIYKKHSHNAVLDHGSGSAPNVNKKWSPSAITDSGTASAANSSAPTVRRKSGMLLSMAMKTGSVDIVTTGISPVLGSGPPSAPPVPCLSRDNSDKRKKSTSSARKASKAMRRRISAARLALRKISHSNRSGSVLDVSANYCSSADERSPPATKKASHDENRSWFLRSPGAILRKSTPPSKKKLGPSLSWDPEHRSRSPSTSSRSRIHSDGSDKPKKKKESLPNTAILQGPDDDGEKLELAATCLHCSLSAEYKRNILRTEIESAVKRLARRLGNRPSSSWPRVDESTVNSSNSSNSSNNPPRNTATPDIVVSSISSDEETESGFGRRTSSERASSLCTSDTR